ncbi:hypothetical protein [Halobacterium rubrum]|uniref:hypothetical protein n=1 Tax=Halobacterium TaxID=2239 RepID=UPI001F248B84|nr:MULTISPECIES: hypothetical protein [Halobacterium]MDH5021735.1 hypothetical protein [Halobacterium rubrum]
MSDDVDGGCGWSELESAVRGPRPDMFPHVDADCIGQFQWDDAEEQRVIETLAGLPAVSTDGWEGLSIPQDNGIPNSKKRATNAKTIPTSPAIRAIV